MTEVIIERLLDDWLSAHSGQYSDLDPMVKRIILILGEVAVDAERDTASHRMALDQHLTQIEYLWFGIKNEIAEIANYRENIRQFVESKHTHSLSRQGAESQNADALTQLSILGLRAEMSKLEEFRTEHIIILSAQVSQVLYASCRTKSGDTPEEKRWIRSFSNWRCKAMREILLPEADLEESHPFRKREYRHSIIHREERIDRFWALEDTNRVIMNEPLDLHGTWPKKPPETGVATQNLVIGKGVEVDCTRVSVNDVLAHTKLIADRAAKASKSFGAWDRFHLEALKSA